MNNTKRIVLTILSAALLIVAMTGCMGGGVITKTAKVMKNKTTVVQANTPWGPQRLIGLNDNTTVIISPDGSLTINPPTDWQPPTNRTSEGFLITPQTTLRVERR